MKKKIFFLFVLSFRSLFPASGDLDTTFGSPNGYVITEIGTSTDGATSVAIQSDGKIVVAGHTVTGGFFDYALVRYNTDGTLDTDFGTGGKVVNSFASSADYVKAMTIQSSGKIVAAGNWLEGNYNFLLARYNTDGSVDTDFGAGGTTVTPVGSANDFVTSMAVQSDGKLVLAGYANNGVNHDFALARFSEDGILDTTFGTNGVRMTSMGSGYDQCEAVVIQSDGKIILAGSEDVTGSPDFALARYDSTGTLDSTFGTGGKVLTNLSSNDRIYDMALQSDEKILVAGHSSNGSNTDFTVARYDTSGVLDPSFGTNGIVTTDVITGQNCESRGIKIQTDGKILVTGFSKNTPDREIVLVRYESDGSLDTSFGTGGIVVTSVSSTNELGDSIAIQSDDKIVVAGITNSGGTADVLVVRYENSIPRTFSIAGSSSFIEALVVKYET